MHPETGAIATRIAWENARHDAYAEHVVQKGEFSDTLRGALVEINSRRDFKEHVVEVLESPETKCFTAFSTEETWRQADIYYHAPTNTAVIVPADREQAATAFRPDAGEAWFEDRLADTRRVEPGVQVQQGGIEALHPNSVKQDQNAATAANTGETMAQQQETSLFSDIIDTTAQSLYEIADGVSAEVNDIANSFSAAHPDVPQEQVQEAAYYAKAVDDPEKYPPLNDGMKTEIEERQAYERVGEKLRAAGEEPGSLSDEQKQELMMEDRMQSYLDRQKEHSM